MGSRTIEAATKQRELAHRAGDGIDVSLLWNIATNLLHIAVSDERSGRRFELIVESGREALDAFRHPFAHAAWRGVEYELTGAASA
jgi:hypothetical protein